MTAWSSIPANVLGDGLRSWQVKATNASSGAADAAYYTLPIPYEGKLLSKSLVQNDSRQVEFPFVANLAYSAKFMATDKTNFIKLLSDLVRNPTDHILTGNNGATFSSGNLGQTKFGLKFRLVSDSDMAKIRYVELITDRNIVLTPSTDWAALIGTPPATGTPSAGDILYKFNTPGISRTTVTPGGANSVTCSAVGGGGATDNLGKIRNFKLNVESLGEVDNLGRTSPCNRARFSFEVEMMQSASAELTQLQVVSQRENDWVVTFVDGTTLTLANPTNIGIDFELHSDTDSLGNQFINIKGGGVVTLLGATWAGMWA